MENSELSYSEEALVARSFFYSPLNDINIFVEDNDSEYLYETIFEKLFSDKYNIVCIFPCGGKQGVIKAYNELGQVYDNVDNYYIVDGDFDRWICSEEMICDSHFIYLESYNIENYFLDENATISFVKGKIKKQREEVKNRLRYSDWENKIVNESKDLFLCYCCVQKHLPTEKTVDRNNYLFLDSSTGFKRTDADFVDYEQEIEKRIPNYWDRKNEIDELYQSSCGKNYLKLICGKFLLDSLYSYIRSIIGCAYKKEDLKWHLVLNINIEKLRFIDNMIETSLCGKISNKSLC